MIHRHLDEVPIKVKSTVRVDEEVELSDVKGGRGNVPDQADKG